MTLSAIFQDSFLLKQGLVAVLLLIITRYVIRFLFRKSRPPLPPGPHGFPIVGALPLIGSMPHVSFAKMAKKYGPIMYLKFGSQDMVVASTPEAAKAFLKTHDLNFSSRPIDAGVHHLAYDGQDMVNAEYGPRWTLLRKVCNTHMFGSKAIENWAHVRVSEVGLMLQDMLEASRKGEPVLMPTMLSYLTANVIGQVVLSRRVFATNSSESNDFKVLVVEMMKYAAVLLVKDIIPALGFLDRGTERKMKELHKQVDAMITKMIEEHIATSHERKEHPDLLDVILTYRDKPDGERLSIENIKGLLLKNKKIDPRGNDFELIPFGAGRRICAGVRMGMVQVEYVLGTLIHSFDWKLPEGVKELDMEEIFGLTLQKAVPLSAMVSPRLAPNAYV
ncbi:hypothetical protein Pint_30833 [Pistacia integerrima]|uniref:Uncharacterized protein n=1 Tax=Pistacia integerrima TaxID=434235 RepID=A0ACC0XQU0_9ROSI|nr:hypothetical protein Pint_30833 [Pistacia integerrima]